MRRYAATVEGGALRPETDGGWTDVRHEQTPVEPLGETDTRRTTGERAVS